jgi:hypothetical protein
MISDVLLMKQLMLGLMISCTTIQENKDALPATEIIVVLLEILVEFREERLDDQHVVVDVQLEELEMWEDVQLIDRQEDVDVQLVA